MRVTVLGSGTFLPSASRSSAGHHLVDAGCSLLLDCGSGTVHGLARHGVSWNALTHVALTHQHPDHAGDLPALLFALRNDPAGRRNRPLTLIGPPGLSDFLGGLAAAWGGWLLEPGFPLRVVEVRDDVPFEDPEVALAVRAVPTPHTETSQAYRVETPGGSLGYTGDTGPSDVVSRGLAGCGLLICECAWSDPDQGPGHLWPEAVAALADRADPELLVLTHLYPPLTPAEAVERVRSAYDGSVVAAADGMVFVPGPDGWTVDPVPRAV